MIYISISLSDHICSGYCGIYIWYISLFKKTFLTFLTINVVDTVVFCSDLLFRVNAPWISAVERSQLCPLGNCLLSQGTSLAKVILTYWQPMADMWSVSEYKGQPLCLNIGWLWRTILALELPLRISWGLGCNRIGDPLLPLLNLALLTGADSKGTPR